MAKRVAITILLVATLAVVTTAAAGSKQRLGSEINVLVGTPTTFTAGAPFHIAHGWVAIDTTVSSAVGKFSFSLQVDGVYRSESFVERTVEPNGTVDRFFVFNFPSGLPAGSHTFIGHWLAPCYAVSGCTTVNPNTVVEAFQRTLTVTFS